MSVYETILRLSKEKGLSQSALERELDFGRGTISKWKRGSVPSSDKLRKLADYFGVTVDYLSGREAPSPQTGGDELKAELFGMPPEMVTDDMIDKVKQFARSTALGEPGAAGTDLRLSELFAAVNDFSEDDLDCILEIVQAFRRYRICSGRRQ
ncbi:helix-turn-helix domain-containing protein [Bacilliculturomica massiliensis]|uniref:helix-turn-helix domain-containing protein n=1 Tax=Bacilliculturomica massiliensis TaxID=1917867 RepID=UPI00103025D6|nr:helix-turn-helix transcriptional regulator [Bacilliculturomica massiliensis]